MSPVRTSFYSALSVLLFLTSVASCSDTGTDGSKELAPLVGTWRARALVLTNKANPSQSVDLVQEGAVFTLSILSSGQYAATMEAFGHTAPEVGTFTVSGSRFTISPTSHSGPPTSGTWKFEGQVLILDGDTEFDFNQDGSREPTSAHFELVRHSP